jgi:hypothetical protein
MPDDHCLAPRAIVRLRGLQAKVHFGAGFARIVGCNFGIIFQLERLAQLAEEYECVLTQIEGFRSRHG